MPRELKRTFVIAYRAPGLETAGCRIEPFLLTVLPPNNVPADHNQYPPTHFTMDIFDRSSVSPAATIKIPP